MTAIGFGTIDHGWTASFAVPSSSSAADEGLVAEYPNYFGVCAD